MTRRGLIFVAMIGLAGCRGAQNALGGEGQEGANFVELFTLFMMVCCLMYVLIILGLALALWRRRGSDPLTVESRGHHHTSAMVKPAMIAWTGLVVVGLTILTVMSFLTDRSNAAVAPAQGLSLTVTANQWWWDVEYSTNVPAHTVRTANEIHLPANVPVQVKLKSNDVIHSFWIPNLAGKQDLIPGRETDVQLLPRKLGRFRGQCAEFCGLQHSKMALDVTVESRADFLRWYAAQLKPPPLPAAGMQAAGYRYFVSGACSSCHNVAGTPATGQVGPDLSHFASRRSIAAGTLPMDRANLLAWLADPQQQKPGNQMPKIDMTDRDRQAMVAYLETLK